MQTTALLLIDTYDEVIFADTQGEWPETYLYLQDYVHPYILDKGIKFTILDGEVEYGGVKTRSLEAFCHLKKVTPSMKFRWCTEKFKITRIVRYIRGQGYPKPITSVMGISYDELDRMHKSHSRTYEFEYPLVDQRLTREDCKRIIRDHGWPIPIKSGCFYCPFQNIKRWRDLYLTHRDLYHRADAIERLSSKYPRHTIHGGPTLARLATKFGEGSRTLNEFQEAICDAGYCMV